MTLESKQVLLLGGQSVCLHIDQTYSNCGAFKCVFLIGLFQIFLFWVLKREPITTILVHKLDSNLFNFNTDWPSWPDQSSFHCWSPFLDFLSVILWCRQKHTNTPQLISQLITSESHKDLELIGRPERDRGEERKNGGRRQKLNEERLKRRIREDGRAAFGGWGEGEKVSNKLSSRRGRAGFDERDGREFGLVVRSSGRVKEQERQEAGNHLSRQNVERKMIWGGRRRRVYSKLHQHSGLVLHLQPRKKEAIKVWHTRRTWITPGNGKFASWVPPSFAVWSLNFWVNSGWSCCWT